LKGLSFFYSLKFYNLKFRTKLILSYLLVTLLCAALIGYFLATRMTRTVIEYTNEINRISFQQTQNNISSKLAGYISISDSILSDSRLVNDLQEEYGSDADYMDQYLSYIRFYPGKLNGSSKIAIRIFTTNGTVLSDRNFIFKVDDQTRREKWYQDILSSKGINTIRGIYLNQNNKMVFSVGRMLNPLESKKYANVLSIEIPESELYDLIEKEGANKDIYVLDGDNRVVTSTLRDSVGKSAGDIPDLREALRDNTGAGDSGARYSKNLILNEGLNAGNSFKDWRIISVTYSKQLFQSIYEILRYSLLICSVIILFSILPIGFLSNKLTKGLRRLVCNMDKIEDGKFDVFVSLNGNDEISELSRSFVNMINRIDNLIKEVYLYDS